MAARAGGARQAEQLGMRLGLGFVAQALRERIELLLRVLVGEALADVALEPARAASSTSGRCAVSITIPNWPSIAIGDGLMSPTLLARMPRRSVSAE